MKLKIDKDGNLHIERAGRWKKQTCPHAGLCGDHCPLFGEPDQDGIEICGPTNLTGEIVDERGQHASR